MQLAILNNNVKKKNFILILTYPTSFTPSQNNKQKTKKERKKEKERERDRERENNKASQFLPNYPYMYSIHVQYTYLNGTLLDIHIKNLKENLQDYKTT